MAERTVQLVVQYDGADFSGWQRQPVQRTVQGVIEEALERLCGTPVSALGSGRTDAGVHARGQAVGVIVPVRWESAQLRRALNAVLPADVWVASAADMRPEFHARYSAVARRYGYHVGTDDEAHAPFRRRFEFAYARTIDRAALDQAAGLVVGDHSFRAFAVQEVLAWYTLAGSVATAPTAPAAPTGPMRGITTSAMAEDLKKLTRDKLAHDASEDVDGEPIVEDEAAFERLVLRHERLGLEL